MSLQATIVLALLSVAATAQDNRTVVRPRDTGVALVNPGMGWVFHHYDNSIRNYGVDLAPWDTVDEFPGASVVYLRLAWSYLEPEEGKFNWSVVDTPAQRWIAKGKQVAFRITCGESGRDQPYATPEWVRKAGAKGYLFTPGKGITADGTIWEPDYGDPIFLEKLDHFLKAAAARYDGNPEVAFIDVGSYGVWGEGHTGGSTHLSYPPEVVRKHIDLYRKHFKHALLVSNDDYGDLVNLYAFDQGLTLRDDSILVQAGDKAYFHADMAQAFWPRLPVILESEHYGSSKNRGYWGDGHLYLKAVEDYHASYASVHWYPRRFLEEARPLIDSINLRLGYRIQLLEASWPKESAAGSPLAIGCRWRNGGVAPCLPGGFPAITLKDEKGGIAALFVDPEFDVRSLPVGPPPTDSDGADAHGARQISRQVTFAVPPPGIFKPGTYSVYVSVGSRTGTPKIALPLAGDDGQHRYRLGEITVR